MTKQDAKKQLFKTLKPTLICSIAALVLYIVGLITDLEGFRDIAFSEGVVIGIIAMPLAAVLVGYCIGSFCYGVKWFWARSNNRVGFIMGTIYLILAQPVGMVLLAIRIFKDIIAYTKA